MTTGTAPQETVTPSDAQFAQLLVILAVVAGLGMAAFISITNNNRSTDDLFVASNGGINRISPDGIERVDWVVNLDNPLTANMFRNIPESIATQQHTVTSLRQRGERWEAYNEDWPFPATVRSLLGDWDPPASDFRPIIAFGTQMGLLAAALAVLALYHPDVRFAGTGLFLGAVSTLAILTETVPFQFGYAVPVAFAALAFQYIRALPNSSPAWLAAVSSAALLVLPLLAWKYTTAVPLRNVVAVQLATLPLLVTGARLATGDR